MAPPQLKSKVFCHGNHDAFEFVVIGSVLVEGAFGRNRLPLGIGQHRTAVDTIGFLPNVLPVFAKDLHQKFYRHFLECFDLFDA